MAKKPKDFWNRWRRCAAVLALILPILTNLFMWVAMKLIHQQPEFRATGRPKDSVARSKTDEAAVRLCRMALALADVRKKPGVTFDTALRAVVASA